MSNQVNLVAGLDIGSKGEKYERSDYFSPYYAKSQHPDQLVFKNF